METLKKLNKKFVLLLSLFSLAIACFVVPKTFHATTSVTISPIVQLKYIKDRHGNSLVSWRKSLSTGEVGYCLDYGKTPPSGQSFNLIGEGDPALAYIMNSSPNMGSIDEDWYVRQVAIYRYLGDASWIQYATQGVKYAEAAQALADEARAATASKAVAKSASMSISPSNAQFNLQGDTYVAGPFTINKSGTMTSINLQLSGIPGAVLKNSSGNVVNNLSTSDTTFTVEVPKASLASGNHTLNINLDGTFQGADIVNVWKTSSNSVQRIGSVGNAPGNDVNKNATATATLNKAPSEGIGRIRKVDATDGTPIQGAVFEIRQNGNVVSTGTTDANGVLDVILSPGTYEVVETSAPAGYVLDSTPKTVTITENNTSEISMPNRPVHASLLVYKEDANTGDLLQGATFALYQNGAEVARQTTNADGIATFSSVKYGSYELREVAAPTGYVISNQVINVEVGPNDNNRELGFNMTNKKITGNVEVLKLDNEIPDLKIEGAVFGLYQGDKLVAEQTTNADGIARFENVEFGAYTLKEISPAEGYLPTTQEWQVDIAEDGKTYNYTVENQIIKGKIQIVKVDANHEEKPVKDAVFELYKATDIGNALATLTTDEDGFAYTEDLRYGDYVLKEVDAPGEYYINAKYYPVSIKENGKVVVQYIVNKPVEFRLKVTKVDGETKEPLAGAHFQIHKDGKPVEFTYQVGSKIVKETTFVSDEDGIILLPTVLGGGDYELVEVKSPVGYNPIDPIPFSVDRDTTLGQDELGPILEITVENFIIKGNVKLLKVENKEKKPLEGVKFELYKKNTIPGDTAGISEEPEGNLVEKIVKTVKNVFSKEKNEAPKADELVDAVDTQPVVDNVKEDENAGTEEGTTTEDADKNVGEDVSTDTVEPALVPSTNLMEGDAKTLENGDTLIGVYATDSNGLIYVEDLKFGDYYFKEVETLEGYVLGEEPSNFSITEHGVTVELTKENRLIEAPVEITKVDINDCTIQLPDTGIKIYEEDGETVVVDGRTDENGVFSFGPLPYGKYWYQEYDAPEGYVIDTEKYPFEIREDGEIVKVQMVNKKKEGELEITKVDVSDGTLLPDTTFAIYGEDGEEVLVKGKTDENGIARFKLEYGKYYYQEIEAPKGYMIDQTKFPFEIKEDGEVVKCKMTNTKLPKTGTVPPTLLAGGIAAIGGLGTLGGVTILRKRKK